jgi:hypothetical protein
MADSEIVVLKLGETWKVKCRAKARRYGDSHNCFNCAPSTRNSQFVWVTAIALDAQVKAQ